jgi:hypothetical protein
MLTLPEFFPPFAIVINKAYTSLFLAGTIVSTKFVKFLKKIKPYSVPYYCLQLGGEKRMRVFMLNNNMLACFIISVIVQARVVTQFLKAQY